MTCKAIMLMVSYDWLAPVRASERVAPSYGTERLIFFSRTRQSELYPVAPFGQKSISSNGCRCCDAVERDLRAEPSRPM